MNGLELCRLRAGKKSAHAHHRAVGQGRRKDQGRGARCRRRRLRNQAFQRERTAGAGARGVAPRRRAGKSRSRMSSNWATSASTCKPTACRSRAGKCTLHLRSSICSCTWRGIPAGDNPSRAAGRCLGRKQRRAAGISARLRRSPAQEDWSRETELALHPHRTLGRVPIRSRRVRNTAAKAAFRLRLIPTPEQAAEKRLKVVTRAFS